MATPLILDLDVIEAIGHPLWEDLDPNPNVHLLFNEFNKIFFDRKLENLVEVSWTSNMNKYTAGDTQYGERGQCKIRLNKALLSDRSRREIVETLLVSTSQMTNYFKRSFKLSILSIIFT